MATRRHLASVRAACATTLLALTLGITLNPTPALAHDAGISPKSPRATYDFNPGWRVFVGDPETAAAAEFDDAAWKSVTLPHGWNEDAAFRESIDKLPTGISWYRKRFTLPAADAGKRVLVEFEGARFGATVYVNGASVGVCDNGVMAFGFDLTDKLTPGENTIAVRVDSNWGYRERATNTPYQWNDRNFYANYGGVNKNVRLHVADKLHQTLPLFNGLGTTGVYVYARDIDVSNRAATIHAESQVKNDDASPRSFGYEVIVRDAVDGKEVKRFKAGARTTVPPGQLGTVSANARLEGLNFWSWGYGHLYDVTTVLTDDAGAAIDTVNTRTGFRKTEFADGVMKLNDRVIHLKGYAQRTTNEWPALGINIPAWVSDFSNRMMVESHGNLVRWMHVTPSKQDVESCDRVGLLQALPAGDSERDPGAGRRWEMRKELMRDAIIYNRNNPSVVMYEGGNAQIADERMAELVKLRDELDPHGGRSMGCRNMLGSEVAEWGGDMLYVNKSAAKPLWATEYNRDEGLRKYWDDFSPPYHKDGDGPLHNNQPARSYNRNGDSFAIQNVRTWNDYYEQRPGTGGRVNAGGVNIIFSDSNTHHRGAENYRRSGEVDAMRIPKDGFFAHKVMWDGWVNVETPSAHVIGHWNYAPDVTKDVHVISSAARVELRLNGKPVGTGALSNGFLHTVKNVKWEPGTLEAVGFDAAGKQVCTDVRKTAGAPAAVKLTPIVGPGGLLADGSDLVLVDVEVVDANGQRCPTSLDAITFALDGPAEWRGGIAQAENNGILAKTLPVECGVNRVSVRGVAGKAGTISLTATAANLKPATVTLASKPVDVTNGLAAMPQAEPPPFLARGPTPPPEVLTPTRLAIKPDRVSGGANPDTLANISDDDETSTWTNDGNLRTAWIAFEFDRPTTIDSMVMRLGSWRTRSYPLRVLAEDGKVLFNGVAGATVGYSTISFPPATGRKFRLELAGERQASTTQDIVEVTGKTDENGGNDRGGRASLAVHELELFGPAAR